jgi:hypothetical protein
LEGYQKRLAVWEEKTRDVRSAMNALLEPRRKELVDDLFVKYPPEIQAAILKPDAERTPIEWQMFYKAKPYMNPDVEEVAKTLKGEARTQYATLKAELEKFAEWHPWRASHGCCHGGCDPDSARKPMCFPWVSMMLRCRRSSPDFSPS